jgi:hypothetical protein
MKAELNEWAKLCGSLDEQHQRVGASHEQLEARHAIQ